MTHPPTPADPGPGPRRRKRDPRATRERLVRAALELFTTQGYHASTTPQIAQRAGVAEGTIYRHFDSKEHLLNEIYRAAVRLLIQHVKETPAALSCRERLARVAEQWHQLAQRDAPLVTLVFAVPLGALLDTRSRDTWRELKEELGKVIASGKASGEVRAGQVDVWTEVWLSLVELVLMRTASREWGPQHTAPAQVIQAAWDAIRQRQTRQEGQVGQEVDE